MIENYQDQSLSHLKYNSIEYSKLSSEKGRFDLSLTGEINLNPDIFNDKHYYLIKLIILLCKIFTPKFYK